MTSVIDFVRQFNSINITEVPMSFATARFLRRALLADAAISGATGILMIIAAEVLERVLDVPAMLLRYAGISLIPFFVFVLYLSARSEPARGSVWLVIALNIAWVIGSVLLLFSNEIEPNSLGYTFVIGQALAVAIFAELQYVGLRRNAA